MRGSNTRLQSFSRIRALVLLFVIAAAAATLLGLLRYLDQVVDAPRELGENEGAAEDESLLIACAGPLTGSRAVIGHNTSATSIPAASIYRDQKIPAISPSATNPKVTTDNPYMFRVVFNDNIQGELLTHYMH